MNPFWLVLIVPLSFAAGAGAMFGLLRVARAMFHDRDFSETTGEKHDL